MLLTILIVAAFAAGDGAINIPINFKGTDSELSAASNDIAIQYADAYIPYMRTNVESAELRQMTQQLAALRSTKDFVKDMGSANVSDKFVSCTVCRAAFTIAERLFRDPNSDFNGPNRDQTARKAVVDLCKRFKTQTPEVCAGYFDIEWPIIDFILRTTTIDSYTFCGTLPISFCKVKNEPKSEWSLKIDSINPRDDKAKSEVPQRTGDDLKILHITDIHYDPEYKPGALADCPEPLCCERMPSREDHVSPDKLAGYWSDYHICDAPLHMVEHAMDHMRNTHRKIDYIYHTGDVIPHTGWKTTEQGNMKMFTEIDELMTRKFPGIPVYPCVGNHDSHPSDLFSPEDVPKALNTKWLYEHLYSLWSKWLPPSTKDTILKGGYYTVSPRTGFRIISLNNLDCYMYNWWLYYNSSYAIQQMEWLQDTLLGAEKAGEHVHILAHVPSGGADCWAVWSQEFNRLVERFQHIISGIFNGHTHKDEMNVYYSESGKAVGIAWNAGSLTTFVGKNPNYRIYDVEPKTMQVVDHETWTFNLTEANAHGPNKTPEWYKVCQFSKDFTTDLSPAGVDAVLERMATQPELLYKFWRCKMTAADPMLTSGCDNNCLLETICELATTSVHQKRRCHDLQMKLKEHLNGKDFTSTKPAPPKPSGHSASATLSPWHFCHLLSLLYLLRKFFAP